APSGRDQFLREPPNGQIAQDRRVHRCGVPLVPGGLGPSRPGHRRIARGCRGRGGEPPLLSRSLRAAGRRRCGEMLRAKYGRDPSEMWARVESEAKKAGMDLDLSKQPRMFNTAKAHTITRLSKPNGNQHELANAIA